MKDAKTRVTVTLPAELAYWMERAARYNKMDKSEFIAEALDRWRRESIKANEKRFFD
jgi:metal-responsive CopG/Arc/MetJ family transcriptional regulator